MEILGWVVLIIWGLMVIPIVWLIILYDMNVDKISEGFKDIIDSGSDEEKKELLRFLKYMNKKGELK